MSPTQVEVEAPQELQTSISSKIHRPSQYLELAGVLDGYEHFDVTPVIGREFPQASLVEWLNAPNSDALIRDLAITIAQRGVVFFRAQHELTNDLQKELITRLGKLTTRPETSGLHIHPLMNSERELGGNDPQISSISSQQHNKWYDRKSYAQQAASGAKWHSDVSFEKVPADFSSLRLIKLPKTGGDTLWASGYEVYDRISPPYQKFLEGLTATFEQAEFKKVADRGGFKLYDKARGSTENVGEDLKAVHPVIRTNPITGWKSVYPIGSHVKAINGVTEEESSALLDWFLNLIYKNHDLQVRFKWKNSNDIAIWDNRSAFHTATVDYDGYGERYGNRAVGTGERPFFDPNSRSRREALDI